MRRHETYGLPVVITNCSNNYGPYHFPEKLIPLTIVKGLSLEELAVYGTGENIRDWLFVEDHAIGWPRERRWRDVLEQLCDSVVPFLMHPSRVPSVVPPFADKPA